MTRILLLAPVGLPLHLRPEEATARAAVTPGTTVEVRHLPGLPATVYVPPEGLFVPHLVEAARAGEREGFDAIGISCCSDPGLQEVRDAVAVPVTAPFEAVASLLPALGPLAVLYVDNEIGEGESTLRGAAWVPAIAQRYGVADHLAVTTAIPVARPAVEPGDDSATPGAVGHALLAAQADALRRHGPGALDRARTHGARTALLACTYWTGQTRLLGRRSAGAPLRVLDPVAVLARHAETLALAGQVAA